METNLIFENEQNPTSKRHVIFEENENTYWLYLTFPNSTEPEIDCFVFNKIDPIKKDEIKNYRNEPCPIVADYSNEKSKLKNEIKEISFDWSQDGNSVAININGEVISFINSKTKCSYSKTVKIDGPWAKKWMENIYLEEFQ